jgi:hypothetical protein
MITDGTIRIPDSTRPESRRGARRGALVSALHRPAPLSAAKGSPPPHLPTAGDRRQGHTRPDPNSATHPGCSGLWLVKRQAAPDQQLCVGLARHTRTQLTRCRVASKPNGLRLLQGACKPSCRMFPLRARATRVRGEPRPFRAKGSAPRPSYLPSAIGISRRGSSRRMHSTARPTTEYAWALRSFVVTCSCSSC